MPSEPHQTDALVAFSRRGLWAALALLLALGAYALIVNLYPDGEAAALAQRFAALLPVLIIIAVAAVRSSLKGVSSNPRSPAMKSMLSDELRQHSLRLAYRYGFFALLFAQPVLALLLAWADASQPVMLMACATALTGVLVVVGSLLVHDR